MAARSSRQLHDGNARRPVTASPRNRAMTAAPQLPKPRARVPVMASTHRSFSSKQLTPLTEVRPSSPCSIAQRCTDHAPDECRIRPELRRVVRDRAWRVAIETSRRRRWACRPLLKGLTQERGGRPPGPPYSKQQRTGFADEPEGTLEHPKEGHRRPLGEHRRWPGSGNISTSDLPGSRGSW